MWFVERVISLLTNTSRSWPGRSAASGAGPTGAGMGPIQDGGVTWYYDREVRTRQASADAPEVSWGLRADLLKAVPGYQTITPP